MSIISNYKYFSFHESLSLITNRFKSAHPEIEKKLVPLLVLVNGPVREDPGQLVLPKSVCLVLAGTALAVGQLHHVHR